MALFKPDVKQLEQKRNIKGLLKAMKYTKDDGNISMLALMALKNLKAKEAIPEIEKFMVYASEQTTEFYQKDCMRRCCSCLQALEYEPQDMEIAALYWGRLSAFNKLAACGAKVAIPQFFASFVRGGYCESWKNAYLTLDSVTGFVSICAFTNQIFDQYKSFTNNTSSINYGQASGRQTGAIVEHMSSLLKNLVDTISEYQQVSALRYLVDLYNEVNNDIYSHSDGGFSDLFGAIKIRSHIVNRISKFPLDKCGEQISTFLTDVLRIDKADTVRHEALWPLKDCRKNMARSLACRRNLRGFMIH